MRQDLLRECLADIKVIPLDEFNKAFCSVCANRECTRSFLQGSVFDKRVNDWHNKLFINVNKADESNENFSHIRSKKFIPINNESIHLSSGFVQLQTSVKPEQEIKPGPVVPVPVPVPTTVSQEVKIQPGGSFTFGGEDE